MAQAENQKDIAKTKLQGVSMLSVNGRANLPPYIGYWSYPVQNYGID